jgi:hypothetical protein
MKAIKNETTQGFEIYLNTSSGVKSVWLKPKQTIIVEEKALTPQLLVLNKRKLVRISNK